MSRSFISAGTPSIIVTLWKIPDDATVFLMQEFYR
ncbi:MAG: CHAT domain-containing protein [Limnothrix sp. RL_2_0]|nr:CHAT domain-containing protein [Limnothrix sp. RL_2_0]